MAKNGISEKQNAFALAYFSHGNAAEAYRTAYDVSDNARDGWIYVEACQLLDNPKVTLRLEQLREEAQKLAIYNVLEASAEYEEARALAKEEKNPSAMVAAIGGKVKLFGLEAPKSSRHEITGKDGDPIKTQEVGNGAAKLAAFLDGIAERSGEAGETS